MTVKNKLRLHIDYIRTCIIFFSSTPSILINQKCSQKLQKIKTYFKNEIQLIINLIEIKLQSVMSLKNVALAISKRVNPARAQQMKFFFKTNKGEYAEGDEFLGLSNPESRQIAKDNKAISFEDLQQLISSKYHQERFIALVILIHKFKKEEEKCYNFYCKNIDFVNNWDLVDCSSYKIIGEHLIVNRHKLGILEELAKSQNLWRRRISIISTLAFIKNRQNGQTYKIADLLLEDKHNLIHKAVGWMLREAGKQNEQQLQYFLQKNYNRLPRTCLRYAIEKFEQSKRKKYLKNQF